MAEKINLDLRHHEEDVEDWKLAGVSSRLYRLFDAINQRFFGGKVPTSVISFKAKQRSQAGHYVIGRNEIGVKENINLNYRHLSDPLQEIAATLAHEAAHCYQFNYGDPGAGSYHNKAFREQVDAMGLPCTPWGRQRAIQEPFVSFLRDLGIDSETRLDLPFKVKNSRSGSSLQKWQCPCGTKIYATGDLQVRCLKCGGEFVA